MKSLKATNPFSSCNSGSSDEVMLSVPFVEMIGQFAITWPFLDVFTEPIFQCVPSMADVDHVMPLTASCILHR